MKTLPNTTVVIVGAGPVGLLLAHFLGSEGVPTRVLEREPGLSDEPRAVAIDPESLRSLQSLGLMEALGEEVLFGLTGDYINGAGELLFELGDAAPGPLGYPGVNGFNQPGLVSVLAEELGRYDCVELLFEHELLAFDQDADGVALQLRDDTGAEVSLRAEFLVGCDGGRSMVRSELGIRMQGESNPRPWLVIDTREKQYDGQRRYRFYCDPARPGMFIQTPHSNRRWEWMLLPGEDRDSFLEDETIHALIAPFVNLDEIEIYRRRVYDFHAIIADQFQQGRVFLAGDAAHMTPPFAGQGLNSGFRDASNLGWKLAAVTRGAPPALLESYQAERWQHARQLIDMAVQLGNDIQPIDAEKSVQRDADFAALNAVPGAMEDFQGGVFKALENRFFAAGAAIDIDQDPLSGRMLVQPLLTDADGTSWRLDDWLGSGFSIIGYDCDPARELDPSLLAPWLALGARIVRIAGPATETGLRDESGYFAELFGAAEAPMLLLRPDRFCMAVFNPQTAADKLARAGGLLGLAESSARGAMRPVRPGQLAQ